MSIRSQVAARAFNDPEVLAVHEQLDELARREDDLTRDLGRALRRATARAEAAVAELSTLTVTYRTVYGDTSSALVNAETDVADRWEGVDYEAEDRHQPITLHWVPADGGRWVEVR